MRTLLIGVDRLLRGEYTTREDLRVGRVAASAGLLAGAGVLLSVFYGLCMGLYAVLRRTEPSFAQLSYSAIKLPILLFLTLLVTLPSLYVFSALARSRLRLRQTLMLLLASTCVTATVLASLGPVTAFFTLSTRSYPFMQSLNVAIFTVAGAIGIAFLRRAVRVVFSEPGPDDPDRRVAFESPPGPAPLSGDLRARLIFTSWIVVYALVGAQMGWILRPFIGDPSRPIVFMRPTSSNFVRGFRDALRGALEFM